MLASTSFDLLIGVDLHFEQLPLLTTSVPFPHPFIGLLFDPLALLTGYSFFNAMGLGISDAFKGPVLIHMLPANTIGNSAKNCFILPHFVIAPGSLWANAATAPKPSTLPGKLPSLELASPPSGDAMMITGSKSVQVMGSNLCRSGDIALSCSEPLRLPSSFVLPIPKGLPVLVGGETEAQWEAESLEMIKCKWISHGLQRWLSRLKSARLRNLFRKEDCYLGAHSVDIAAGRVLRSVLDFELPGPLPLYFKRHYVSAFSYRDSPLGYGWSHSLNQELWLEPGCVVYRAEDGREIEFDTFELDNRVMKAGDSIFEPMNRLKLRYLGEMKWEVESPDGTLRKFGKVSGDSEEHRARLLQKRSRAGHGIELHYDKHALLAAARDSGGRMVHFQHDKDGRLVQISLPHPTKKGFVPCARFSYSAQGDLIEAADALGHITRYEYAGHLLVRETDRTGLSFYFGYDGLGPEAYCIRTWGDGGISDHIIDYDKIKRCSYVSNSLGELACYEMNEGFAPTKITDALGGESHIEYDDHLWKIAETDALGNRTGYEYDSLGNCRKIKLPGGAELQFEYDERNLPIKIIEPCGGVWLRNYNEHGLLIRRVDPLGEATVFLQRDGMPAEWHGSSGAKTSLDYDQHRGIRHIKTASGKEYFFERDAWGRALRCSDKRGSTLLRHYDAAGRLSSQEEPDGNIRRFSYDGEGYLLRLQDQFRDITYQYQGFHKLCQRQEGDDIYRFAHDSEGRLESIRNPIGEQCRFERDAAGRVRREIGFDGRATEYVRDAAGRVIQKIRPSGAKTKIERDAMGRVLSLSYSDGKIIRYTYRADGALMCAETGDSTVRFERDLLGRAVKEIQGDQWVQTRYTPSGQRSEILSSIGVSAKMSWSLQREGQLQTLVFRDAAGPWTVSFAYDELGMETERKFPNGVSVQRSYDSIGRLQSYWARRESTELLHDIFQWAEEGRLQSRRDMAGGLSTFEYDSAGRLSAARHADGRVEHRRPDALGRPYRYADRSDRRYAPGGGLAMAEGVEYRYDADGQLIEKRWPDGRFLRFRYEGPGWLASAERSDGTRIEFGYDALGRRIRKRVNETEYHWIWDGSAPLHEISTESGLTTWIFDSTGFVPLCKAQGKQRYGVVADQSGAPLALLDEHGRIAWSARLDIYGVAAPGLQLTDCPLRFPGQYEDTETGLYYAHLRYYDPHGGRYITQNPLGLEAGLDVYAYVDDPLTQMDLNLI